MSLMIARFPGELGKGVVKECELYDLRRDMGERVNVITQHPEVVKDLTREANVWREELGDDLTGHKGKARREPGKSDKAVK